MTISRDILQANTLADLRAMPVDADVKVFLLGKTSLGDSLGGFYYWDPSSTATEDSVYLNVLASSMSGTGRWRRVFSKVIQYPHGVMISNAGVKTFYASGVTTSAGDCTLNLTEDNTSTGAALFTEIWSNVSRAKTTATGPNDAVNSYTKSEAANLKTTVHGFFKPNPVTISLGLLYAPLAAAPAGIPVRFEIVGV